MRAQHTTSLRSCAVPIARRWMSFNEKLQTPRHPPLEQVLRHDRLVYPWPSREI